MLNNIDGIFNADRYFLYHLSFENKWVFRVVQVNISIVISRVILLSPIYPIPQPPGALKCDDPPFRQNHILIRCRISPSTFPFVPNPEFTESRYQNILAWFQRVLYDFKECFSDVGGFFKGIPVRGLDGWNDNRLGEGLGHNHLRCEVK